MRRRWLLLAFTAGTLATIVVLWSPWARPEPELPRIPAIVNLDELDPSFALAVRRAIAAVERSRSSAQAWGKLGHVYNAHEYVGLARESYSTAHFLASEAATWPYHLGILAAQLGQSGVAAGHFQQTLNRQPDYLPARSRLASLHLSSDRLEDAEEILRAVVEQSPNTSWGHLGLGRIAWKRRQLTEAKRYLERSRELDPLCRKTAYLLGLTYLELGLKKQGAELLEGLDALQSSPVEDPYLQEVASHKTDLGSRTETANRLLAQSQLQAAEMLYRGVLDFDPDHFDAHHNLGVLYGQKGDYEAAQEHVERALDLRPTSAEAHFSMAMVYWATDRMAEVAGELNRVLELDPRHPEAPRYLEALKDSD